jgi:hypothetical protein
MTNWHLKGTEFANCNCAYGCGCQFNALPTHGHCSAVAAFQIDEGRFGGLRLDGLRAAGIYTWPGPVHEGNGRMQLVVDEAASDAQFEAMIGIMTGRDTREMATMWWVFSAMSPHKLPSLRRPISFTVDVDARRGEVRIPGLVEMHGQPIRNPVTGAEHRARIDLPEGFEYELAEIGSGTSRVTGDIALDLQGTYGQFARLHLNQDGVVRERARPKAVAAPA